MAKAAIVDGDENRFSLIDAYNQPFVPGPLHQLEVVDGALFAERELDNTSDEYLTIKEYFLNGVNKNQNKISECSIKIYQYKRKDDSELTKFDNANWLLWTGTRATSLPNIKLNGLRVPGKEKKVNHKICNSFK